MVTLFDGDAFHFNEPSGTTYRGPYDDSRYVGVSFFETGFDCRIISRIPQVDDDLSQILFTGFGFGQQGLYVFQHSVDLSLNIAGSHDVSAMVDAGRTRKENMAAVAVFDADSPFESDSVFIRGIQMGAGIEDLLLFRFEPVYGIGVQGYETSRISLTALDAGTGDIVGFRSQVVAFENRSSGVDDSSVIDIHVLDEKDVSVLRA